ncbi:hypothetical protein Hanom_Chr13g01223931 [Helianthus anomalus]
MNSNNHLRKNTITAIRTTKNSNSKLLHTKLSPILLSLPASAAAGQRWLTVDGSKLVQQKVNGNNFMLQFCFVSFF